MPCSELQSTSAAVSSPPSPSAAASALKAERSSAATWTADDHPGDWREQQQRWDRLHYAGVAIIVAASVLTLVAASVI